MPKTEHRPGDTRTEDADVITLIRSQHRQIHDLFDRLLSASMSERDDVFCELRRMLAVHETAEELIVHPALRTLGDTGRAIADERLDEEGRAKQDLAEIEDIDTDHPEFLTRIVALRGEIVDHAAMEEEMEHPLLRDLLSEDRRRSMATAFRAAEAAAPTHPHPHGPDSALGNLVVGPFASITDRVRDAISGLRS